MIVVGDVSVHSRAVDDTAVRLVSMPTANGPDTAAILDEYEDVFETYRDRSVPAGAVEELPDWLPNPES